MPLQILHAATAEAVALAVTQPAQAAALIAAWAGGDVTARIMAGTTLLSTATHGPWVVNGSVNPRTLTIGGRLAQSHVATGVPTRVVFRAAGNDIFQLTAGIGSGDVQFAQAIGALAKERLSVTIAAAASLPAGGAPPAPSIVVTGGGSSGQVGVASAPWTVTVQNLPTGQTLNVAITRAPSGTLSTSSLALTSSNPSGQFTLTPIAAATHTLSFSNNLGLSNPGNISYTATVEAVSALRLVADDTGTAGTPGSATVFNDGTAAGSWQLTSSPAGLTPTPASGTTAAGGSTAISLAYAGAATFALQLADLSGRSVSGSPQSIIVAAAPVTPPPPPPAPDLATLSGGNTAIAGQALTSRVTLNRAALVAYTVNWSRSNSGTGPATSTINVGQTYVDAASTWASAGAGRSVDFTISPSLTRAGRPLAVTVNEPSEPVEAGTWEQLTVASLSRKVISFAGVGSNGTFDATKALAVEAQAPVLVTGIPARAFSVPVPGERGMVYLTGGLHSNYQGNEIDRMALPTSGTEIVTTISHQPNMPPEGKFSGYASGNGGYLYRQYGGGLGDPSNWQPYPGHQWSKNGWGPYWGFFSLTAHAVQTGSPAYPNGAYSVSGGIVVSSAAQPGDEYGQQEEFNGVVAFDWTAGKYKTHISSMSLPYPFDQLGESGVSDWNNWDQTQLFLNTRSGSLNIARWNPITGMAYPASMTAGTSTAVVGGADGHGGNGLLCRVLEQRKYLILQQGGSNTPGGFRGRLFVYSEDFGAGNARFVQLTPPAPAFADWDGGEDCLSFVVDRNSRRVFWLVFPGVTIPIRLYVSSFDDLMAWTQVIVTPDIVVPNVAYANAWIAANRQPMIFQDGYLFLMDGSGSGPGTGAFNDGRVNWKRVKIDQGEDLPAFNFQRLDYRQQNFQFTSDPGTLQLWGVKHANWAFNPADGKHYLCAGDLGSSTCGSLATLEMDGSPRGYTFTETLNETTNPPAGKVRPSSPDDGHWFHVPTTSPWVEGRGKFVWMRGGDGEPMFYNAYLRTKYVTLVGGTSSSNGTQAQVAAALADGWDIQSKLYLFDPATTTFTRLGAIRTADFSTCEAGVGPSLSSAGMTYPVSDANGWTQDNGSTFFPSVWLASSASSRNGAFDATTGVLWRFYNTGSPSLASFDFINKVVRFHSLARWLSPETARNFHTSGASPTAAEQVIADGTKPKFGFYDESNGRYITPLGLEWEHKATWLDERDGKLYAVNPVTGYLWSFETRATPTNGGDGWVLPFYPVGNRIPLTGVYPPRNARNGYPPVADPGKDSRMQQFLAPFKGGLLWWGSSLHDSGTFGYPRYAFWRRLGFTGDWTVVTMPIEFAANSFSVVSKAHDNAEIVMLNGGGNYLETQGPWPWLWRLT